MDSVFAELYRRDKESRGRFDAACDELDEQFAKLNGNEHCMFCGGKTIPAESVSQFQSTLRLPMTIRLVNQHDPHCKCSVTVEDRLTLYGVEYVRADKKEV